MDINYDMKMFPLPNNNLYTQNSTTYEKHILKEADTSSSEVRS
jgi:hypothetical protein